MLFSIGNLPTIERLWNYALMNSLALSNGARSEFRGRNRRLLKGPPHFASPAAESAKAEAASTGGNLASCTASRHRATARRRSRQLRKRNCGFHSVPSSLCCSRFFSHGNEYKSIERIVLINLQALAVNASVMQSRQG